MFRCRARRFTGLLSLTLVFSLLLYDINLKKVSIFIFSFLNSVYTWQWGNDDKQSFCLRQCWYLSDPGTATDLRSKIISDVSDTDVLPPSDICLDNKALDLDVRSERQDYEYARSNFIYSNKQKMAK